MNADVVSIIYRSTAIVFEKSVAGISEIEARQTAVAHANSMNWIAGHIVATRNDLFAFINEPLSPAAWTERYRRGTAPEKDEDIVSMETIVLEFQASQEQLVRCFTERDWSLEQYHLMLPKIAWFGFHESYHCGQLGLLRKALGKEAIIK
jgi:hypothetical protein